MKRITPVLLGVVVFCCDAVSGAENVVRFTYGKVVQLRGVVVNSQYQADVILDGISGGAVEYTFRLFDDNLITVASKGVDRIILTDCVKIHYDDVGIRRLIKVHGDHCIRIR